MFLKYFVDSTGKHELESLFDKAADLKTCNSIKKGLQRMCFSVKFAKIFKTFTEEFQWLLVRFNWCFHKGVENRCDRQQ